MSVFQDNAITEVGRSLHSHVQVGAVFTPTRIVLGDGYMPSGKSAKTMTDVVSVVKTLAIVKKERSNDGKATFGAVYSNQDIASNWYFRELALYAKAVYPDGTEVAECLYSYGNAGANAELMPAYSTGQPVERQMDLVTWVGSDATINLTIDTGLPVMREEMGAPGGVATLGADGILAEYQRPTAQQIGALPKSPAPSNDLNLIAISCVTELYEDTKNAPYDLGITSATHGLCFTAYAGSGYAVQLALLSGESIAYIRRQTAGYWDSTWTAQFTEAGGVIKGYFAVDIDYPYTISLVPWDDGSRVRTFKKETNEYRDFIFGDDSLVYRTYNSANELIRSLTIASTEYVDNAAPGLVPASVE